SSLITAVVVRTEVPVRQVLTEAVTAETTASDIVNLWRSPMMKGFRPLLFADIFICVMPSRRTQVELPMSRRPNREHFPPLGCQLVLGGFSVRHNRDAGKCRAQQQMTGRLACERRFVNSPHISLVEVDCPASRGYSEALQRSPAHRLGKSFYHFPRI